MRTTEDYQKEYLKLFPEKRTIWNMPVPWSKDQVFNIWDIEFLDWIAAEEEKD